MWILLSNAVSSGFLSVELPIDEEVNSHQRDHREHFRPRCAWFAQHIEIGIKDMSKAASERNISLYAQKAP